MYGGVGGRDFEVPSYPYCPYEKVCLYLRSEEGKPYLNLNHKFAEANNVFCFLSLSFFCGLIIFDDNYDWL